MAVALVAPQFVAQAPNVLNTGTTLYVSVPLKNAGAVTAPTVLINSLTLGSAPRLTPEVLPVFLGTLATGNGGTVNATFDARALVPGKQYLLTIRGTYGPSSSRVGFSVNRWLTIPAAAPYPVPLLNAHVVATMQTATWNYTLFNDEPATSTQFLSGFSLTVAAAISVTGTPSGWDVDTDNFSYVFWYATDLALPYPNQVAPGGSLGGFQLQSPTPRSESTPYVITSWMHDSDAAGLVVPGSVASPGRAY